MIDSPCCLCCLYLSLALGRFCFGFSPFLMIAFALALGFDAARIALPFAAALALALGFAFAFAFPCDLVFRFVSPCPPLSSLHHNSWLPSALDRPVDSKGKSAFPHFKHVEFAAVEPRHFFSCLVLYVYSHRKRHFLHSSLPSGITRSELPTSHSYCMCHLMPPFVRVFGKCLPHLAHFSIAI